MSQWTPADVSAVVCTLNSIASVERCLQSLRSSRVGEVIVVDAGSTDGTREIASQLSDRLLDDPGIGLGRARNIGIGETQGALVLNLGSDNVLPPYQLVRMISCLEELDVEGVSAQTLIEGAGYATRGLNAWRSGRFRPGRVAVIGTPTLFRGDLLRAQPYDETRRFSDDSELCERWSRKFGAKFAICDAHVLEVGKTSWDEVVTRCRMYGTSDEEVFRAGRESGWPVLRQAQSLLHPLRVDLVEPVRHLPIRTSLETVPFLSAFAGLRYVFWVDAAWRRRGHGSDPRKGPRT